MLRVQDSSSIDITKALSYYSYVHLLFYDRVFAPFMANRTLAHTIFGLRSGQKPTPVRCRHHRPPWARPFPRRAGHTVHSASERMTRGWQRRRRAESSAPANHGVCIMLYYATVPGLLFLFSILLFLPSSRKINCIHSYQI